MHKCRNFNAKLIMAWDWVVRDGWHGGATCGGQPVYSGTTWPGTVTLVLSCDQAMVTEITSVVIYSFDAVQCCAVVMWTGLNIMVFDSSGSSEGGRAVWMENVMPQHPPPTSMGLRSLPPYQPPPTPSRYNFPTYTSPWLVRVSNNDSDNIVKYCYNSNTSNY